MAHDSIGNFHSCIHQIGIQQRFTFRIIIERDHCSKFVEMDLYSGFDPIDHLNPNLLALMLNPTH